MRAVILAGAVLWAVALPLGCATVPSSRLEPKELAASGSREFRLPLQRSEWYNPAESIQVI
jgi:hypothetical protein